MAKVVFGPIIADARNKCGDVVFTRNRGGQCIRARINPKETVTPRRTAFWNNTTDLSPLWNTTLSEAQRQQWRLMADILPQRDKLGNTHLLSGQQWFMRLNGNLWAAGLPNNYDAPPNLNALDPQAITISATSPSTITITPDNTPPAGYGVVAFFSAPLSPGRISLSGVMRWIAVPGSDGVHTPDLTACGPNWQTKFGDITPGIRIAVLIRYINPATGAPSPTYRADCIAD